MGAAVGRGSVSLADGSNTQNVSFESGRDDEENCARSQCWTGRREQERVAVGVALQAPHERHGEPRRELGVLASAFLAAAPARIPAAASRNTKRRGVLDKQNETPHALCTTDKSLASSMRAPQRTFKFIPRHARASTRKLGGLKTKRGEGTAGLHRLISGAWEPH